LAPDSSHCVLSSTALPSIPSDRQVVLSRVTRRLIPFAFICYVVAYIDRVNIGFAQRELQRDLGLSDTEYGIGAGLFFLGYCLFEIPSNLILERVGARRWIARIMIGWGLVSMATMFITDVWSFMTARVVLGIAEAGFFPGMVLYLTYWIPAAERAKANALFMMAAPVSVIVGAPVSEALLAMDGIGGLRGWQWLFLIEGLPAVILGVLALKVLTDRPEHAAWLPPPDREWLATTMNAERALRGEAGHVSVGRSLRSGRVWLLSVIYLMNATVTYGIFLWLPRMLQDAAGPGRSVGVLTALPFVAALIAMVLIGRHSDKTGERKLHVAACAVTAAIGLFLAVAFRNHLYWLVLAFTICQIGQRSVMSVFWTMPPMLLGGAAAAAGIAMINAIGNLGGFFGPTIMGSLRDLTGGYSGGLLVLAGALIIEAILVSILKLPDAPSKTPAIADPQPAVGGPRSVAAGNVP
jgi:MFS transporter, ACS family, tartrate transporter